MHQEFSEIGHCGGKFSINVKTDEAGNRSVSIGMRISNANPASLIGVAVNSDGEPVRITRLGGWVANSEAEKPEPEPVFIQALLASDRTGMFGHECPNCEKYWRTNSFSAIWHTVCPYCGVRAAPHYFLTQGHRAFLKNLTQRFHEALGYPDDGEHIIDMDEVVSAVQDGKEPPAFYKADESQQTNFKCKKCGTRNDVLGRYGFCSSCGYRNNLDQIEIQLDDLKKRIGTGNINPTEAIKLIVSVLDSGGADYVKLLVRLVPMTESRRKTAERIKFHNLDYFDSELQSCFDIQVKKNISDDDQTLLKRMFLRRHVYEHCGGVVDDEYIKRSGDVDVRNGQEIRENMDTALKFSSLVTKLARNLDDGFHEIIPINHEVIQMLKPRRN
ncbi:hypothetical protein SAMN02744133_11816 [Thalassospira xiamenensis M-5 = DSM 17429]|nr:hypothetical protein [Thalassospira xiamenensis]SIT30725.1 hypothetical protein SAMN02744133_11816 [Thalassospira xiamenensis M-5 = DSM 17429]